MPELPEVETIRRQLDPVLRGRRIQSASVLDERWSRPAPPRDVEGRLAGRRIEGVERRGKYLVLRLDGNGALVMHLRMTGNLLIADRRLGGERLYEGSPELRYLRAWLELDDGSRLLFTDVRRFGHGAVLDGEELEAYFAARLGVEPLSGELTAE